MGRSAAKANLPDGPGGTMPPEEFAERLVAVYGKLWLLAAGITGDRTQADDLVQEAAVVALAKLDQFRPGSNDLAWMAEIVRFQALNYSRKTRQRRTSTMDPVDLDRTQAAPGRIVRKHATACGAGILPAAVSQRSLLTRSVRTT